ncbi:MAG: MFS transporter [Oscillospiraceae bacterium]|nr:MFS transporter [Oscillospiraceae bacterium]
MNSNRNTGSTRSNFGGWGWSMIIYCALIYYFAAGMSTDGLNIYPEAFAAFRGWDANTISAFATIGGLTAIPGTIVFSILAEKRGTRFTAALGLILTGLSTVVFALASSWPVFAVASILVQFFAGSILLSVVPNTLMNVWFPTKKGLALGWASMGMPLCTATFVALVAALIGVVGPATTYMIVAVILVVFGLLSLFWVKDSPEAVGCAPDNIQMTPEEIAKSKQAFEAKTAMTVRTVMRDKRAWAIGIGLGLMWMTTVGIVSRLVPRLVSIGYAQTTALSMLTAAALCGIFGSYCWGWLDQKFGTRKTGIIYGFWYILALILLMVGQNHIVTMIAIVIVGIGIGGIGNLVPSMIGTVYGRKDYLVANRLIMPLCTIVRSCAFALMSFAISVTNGYTGAYAIFIVACIAGILVVWSIGKSGDKPVEVAHAQENADP